MRLNSMQFDSDPDGDFDPDETKLPGYLSLLYYLLPKYQKEVCKCKLFCFAQFFRYFYFAGYYSAGTAKSEKNKAKLLWANNSPGMKIPPSAKTFNSFALNCFAF